MVYAAILAGGKGTRVKKAKVPKQFIEIKGLPIIFYTIKNILKVKRFDYLYIAVHKDFIEYLDNVLKDNLDKDEYSKIKIILGGKERIDTIFNVTDAITDDNGIQDDDVIVIHDSVRPFVTEKILNDSIDYASKYGAVVTALPASDTILHSKDGKIVSEIPDRSTVFHGQAPDSFNLKKLIEMEENLTSEQKEIIVGTSQFCTFNNVPMYMIEGDAINFKITTDSDLEITKNILNER